MNNRPASLITVSHCHQWTLWPIKIPVSSYSVHLLSIFLFLYLEMKLKNLGGFLHQTKITYNHKMWVKMPALSVLIKRIIQVLSHWSNMYTYLTRIDSGYLNCPCHWVPFCIHSLSLSLSRFENIFCIHNI